MHKNNQAFCLLELLVVIALLTILFAMGIPSYQDFIERNRANATMIQLYRAIQLARSEAIKHHCIVTLCPTDDNHHCTNNNNWNHGYLVFLDPQVNGKILKQNQIIRSFSFIANKGNLSWTGFPNKNVLQMTPLGFTHYQNGTFLYCPKSRDVRFARALFIIQSGRVRFSRDQHQDGIHKDSNGRPLQCS